MVRKYKEFVQNNIPNTTVTAEIKQISMGKNSKRIIKRQTKHRRMGAKKSKPGENMAGRKKQFTDVETETSVAIYLHISLNFLCCCCCCEWLQYVLVARCILFFIIIFLPSPSCKTVAEHFDIWNIIKIYHQHTHNISHYFNYVNSDLFLNVFWRFGCIVFSFVYFWYEKWYCFSPILWCIGPNIVLLWISFILLVKLIPEIGHIFNIAFVYTACYFDCNLFLLTICLVGLTHLNSIKTPCITTTMKTAVLRVKE